jgi:hypothetical protein
MPDLEHTLADALHAEVDGIEPCDCLDRILARVRRASGPAVSSPAAGPGRRCIYQTAWRWWAAGVLATFAAIELPGLRTVGGHGTAERRVHRCGRAMGRQPHRPAGTQINEAANV